MLLRNGLFLANRVFLIKDLRCQLSTGYPTYCKYNGVGRQAKIMSKLFGARVSGSKKHWYPTHDNSQTGSHIFQASPFTKTGTSKNGKNVTRRMTVLNKLFMKHITDLLATGEVSEGVIGRNLQITRVKITNDFANVNVYWLGSGDVLADQQLEEELHRCGGLIRHELSQLRLMGEVPRIHFVREKLHDNLAYIDSLLSKMDLSQEEKDDQNANESNEEHSITTNLMENEKNEFYGNRALCSPANTDESTNTSSWLPTMRHDVFALDHKGIMTKILTKMRKSKQAWELHNQGTPIEEEHFDKELELERIRRKLTEAEANKDKFNKYLATRRDQKQTPERKKYSRIEQLEEMNAANEWLSNEDFKNDREFKNDEDFLPDENERQKPY